MEQLLKANLPSHLPYLVFLNYLESKHHKKRGLLPCEELIAA